MKDNSRLAVTIVDYHDNKGTQRNIIAFKAMPIESQAT